MVAKLGRFAWMCLGLLVSSACQAESESSPGWNGGNFSLSGFGTLGLAHSDTDSVEYVRDLSQPHGLQRGWSGKIDSVLGLQANLKLGAQTEGVVQAVSRYRYDGSYRPEVSWAFLRHDFTPDLQMRFGRLGTEFYMQADSRLVGYANLAVRPPPDFFVPLIFSDIDGIDASASLNLEQGLVRAKLFAGRSPEHSPFVDPITWNLKGSRLMGGHLDFFTGPWQFRIGRSSVRFSSHEIPLSQLVNFDIVALIPELSTIHKTSDFDSVGVIYDQGPLRIHAMAGRVDHESSAYEDSRAAFVIGSYRIGAFTPYLGYSRIKPSASTFATQIPVVTDIARSLTLATHADQHTVTIGARWDFRQHWALKVQFDAIRGSPTSLFPFRGDSGQWNGRMNVLSTTLDFAF